MKKEEVPQDGDNKLEGKFNWLNYAVNEKGEYTTENSIGWEPENVAMEQAWEQVNEKVSQAEKDVRAGVLSPVGYFMEKNMMELAVLARHMGKFSFQIKRHFNPNVFKRLPTRTLLKYAYVFRIDVETLQNPFKD